MKTVKKVSLILLAIALIVGSYYVVKMLKTEYIFSIRMVSGEEYDEIIDNRQEATLEDAVINLNDEGIARLDNGDYYLVQKNEEEYNGTISIEENKYNLAIIKPEKTKLELIKEGEPLKILIYNGDNYEIRNIYLTYLPLIQISNSDYFEWGDLGKDVYTADLYVYSYMEDEIYQKETFRTKHHIRGNLTLEADKKSYSLDLIDEDGNRDSASLLNMRDDDDWNLMSMCMDASFIKEKLSMDVWSWLSPYSIESRYVEFIKDGEYMGLYLLSEPTDMKTLDGDSENDILVKISNWLDRDLYGETLREDTYCLKEDKCVLEDITYKNLRWNDEDRDEMYKLALEFHKYYEDSESDIFEFDYDNCVEYSVFLQLTMATDNTYKNERMLLVRDGDKYKITKGAWDFDYNFRSDNVYKDYLDIVLPLEYKNSSEYYKDCAKLYESIKDYYNEENLLSIIDEYNTYLTNSGILSRIVKNNEYIESSNYETAVSDLKEVIKKRVVYVDNYYKNILEGD